MAQFVRHKVLESGATEYRLINTTRTVRFGARLFPKDGAPDTIEIGDESTPFAPVEEVVNEEAKAAKKAEKDAAREAKAKEREEAKAKKAAERDEVKAKREAERAAAREEREKAREAARAAAAESAENTATDQPAASM